MPDVFPSADAEDIDLSICIGEAGWLHVARRDALSMSKESVCSDQGATVPYVELETSISVYLQGEVPCEGSGQF